MTREKIDDIQRNATSRENEAVLLFKAVFSWKELRGCNVLGRVEGKGKLDEARVRYVEKLHRANSTLRSDAEKDKEWKKGVQRMNHEICRTDAREKKKQMDGATNSVI